MNRSMISRASILALTALAGCYAQVEDTNVSYSQTRVCGAATNCPGGNAPLTLISNFIPSFTISLGDSGVLTSSQSSQGPITFNGSVILNEAIVTMTTANADFSGIRTVDLRAAIGTDNCAQLSATCKSVASYDFARDGAANQKLILKGSGANLLDFASGTNHDVKLSAKATGNAPATATWNADAELSLSIKARGTFP
ncbi:MAG TPA: hypothetical protein VN918_09635 [Myxococcaceae bacterium]|nr:hypothetical protein [Myxococcaceae bacterium]